MIVPTHSMMTGILIHGNGNGSKTMVMMNNQNNNNDNYGFGGGGSSGNGDGLGSMTGWRSAEIPGTVPMTSRMGPQTFGGIIGDAGDGGAINYDWSLDKDDNENIMGGVGSSSSSSSSSETYQAVTIT